MNFAELKAVHKQFCEAPVTLRDLRKWHMGQVERLRARANDRRASSFTRETYNLEADFHMKAVQALNDCFEAGDNDHLGKSR